MTEAKTNSKSKSNVLSLVYMAMFVAIITVCAQIQIPMTVPFTLQTLGIFMAAAMLGWKRGLISVAVYVLLGAIGVPVFAGFSGGIGVLGGPTGGYIIGFLFTALIVGLMTDFLGRKLWVLAVSMVAGLAVCYLFRYNLVYDCNAYRLCCRTSHLRCSVPSCRCCKDCCCNSFGESS